MKKNVRLISVIRIAELCAALERIVAWLEELSAEGDSYLTETTTKLKEMHESLVAALNRSKISTRLEAFDNARDTETRLLYKLIDGYTAHPNEKIAAAAVALSKICAKYPAMWNLNQNEQSGMTKSLLGDFVGETENIAVLDGVAVRVANVKKAHEDFEAAHKTMVATNEQERATDSASSLKKPILVLVNDDLLPYLATMRRIQPAQYEKLAALIDREIQNVNDKVSARSKSATKGEKTPDVDAEKGEQPITQPDSQA